MSKGSGKRNICGIGECECRRFHGMVSNEAERTALARRPNQS